MDTKDELKAYIAARWDLRLRPEVVSALGPVDDLERCHMQTLWTWQFVRDIAEKITQNNGNKYLKVTQERGRLSHSTYFVLTAKFGEETVSLRLSDKDYARMFGGGDAYNALAAQKWFESLGCSA